MSEHKYTSDSMEWFSPPAIIEAARCLMGGIDLDPASCELANGVVGAAAYFDEESNGFTAAWRGRVFLNPPGGYCDSIGRRVIHAASKKGVAVPDCTVTGACGLPPGHEHGSSVASVGAWWEKLVVEWQRQHVRQAVFVGFNLEVLRSTQSATIPAVLFPFCIPAQRLRFYRSSNGRLVEGASPPHASAIIWLPPVENSDDARGDYNMTSFRHEFGDIGACP